MGIKSPRQVKYVLVTSANFPRGSAAASYLNLFCKGIALSGYTIDVYLLKGYFLAGRKTDDHKRNFTDYGVKYTYLSFINRSSNKMMKVIGDLYGTFSLMSLLISRFGNRRGTTFFAYNNELHHSLLLNIICRLSGMKIVTFVPEYYDISEFSGNFFNKLRWYSFLLNFHYINRLSNKLIVFSDYIRTRYLEKKYPENRIFVQPNLTDFDFWYKDSVAVTHTLGYSGTPYKKDGIRDLLTAISLLSSKRVEINALIVGDVVNEKSIIPSLKEFCKELGIENNVSFTGIVSHEEVREWLNKCSILAITRPNIIQTVAGFPTKVGEYFACKKIVLSTKIGDIGNYFIDRSEIVFAEAGNPSSIADNIEWILNNKEECKDISINGYTAAKNLLNYKSKVPVMVEFVNDL